MLFKRSASGTQAKSSLAFTDGMRQLIRLTLLQRLAVGQIRRAVIHNGSWCSKSSQVLTCKMSSSRARWSLSDSQLLINIRALFPAHSYSWEQVTTEFNKRATIQRSADSISKKWHNIIRLQSQVRETYLAHCSMAHSISLPWNRKVP